MSVAITIHGIQMFFRIHFLLLLGSGFVCNIICKMLLHINIFVVMSCWPSKRILNSLFITRRLFKSMGYTQECHKVNLINFFWSARKWLKEAYWLWQMSIDARTSGCMAISFQPSWWTCICSSHFSPIYVRLQCVRIFLHFIASHHGLRRIAK